MRLPTKALVWGFTVAMPIMASGFSLPLYAATSALADRKPVWSCSHPDLPSWLRVCTSIDGKRLYQVDTGNNGPHGRLEISGAVTLQQTDPDTVHMELSITSARSFRSGLTLRSMVKNAYEDEGVTIDEVRNEQQTPTWVMYSRDGRPSPFLIEMCAGADCSGGIYWQDK